MLDWGEKEGSMRSVILVLVLIATIVGVALWSKPADCNWCVPIFCGTDAQCPSNCSYAIPWGKVTGRCSG